MSADTLVTIGDSKTWAGGWQSTTESSLETETGTTWNSYNLGANSAALTITSGNQGFAVNYMTTLDGRLATVPAPLNSRVIVTVNFGVNDYCCSGFDGVAWKAALTTLLDKVWQRWPDSQTYVAIPWNRDHDADANTMAGLIADVIATRPGRAFLGPDERVWLKGADNGATMTSDGTHYSASGNTQAPIEWMTSFGY